MITTRHKKYKECVNECLKSFESAMKVICTKKGWAFNPTDTAKSLINVCENNGLFASFLQTHVANLRALLESGVPTTRNKTSGHGQGANPTVVNEATAKFVMHSTATSILFFIDSSGL